MRYALSEAEWTIIQPILPSRSRGVPRVDDRRVLDGIFWILRSGAPWRDLPERYGPYTTCYNRFVRWRRAGVWDRIMESLADAHDAAVQMIDTSVIRVHQHGACVFDSRAQSIGRSRGGLTTKLHAVVDANGLPVRLGLTGGQAHDNRLCSTLLGTRHRTRNSWPTGDTTRTGSEPSSQSAARGPTSRREGTEHRQSALARTSTGTAIGSSGSSTGSNIVGAWQRGTTSLLRTTSPSSSSPASVCGYGFMSHRVIRGCFPGTGVPAHTSGCQSLKRGKQP